MRSHHFQIKPTEFRVGNLVTVKYADEKKPRTVQLNAKQLSDILDNRGLTVQCGVILTEDNIKHLRREYFVNGERHLALEFSVTPAGERQIENNWWSREIDMTRLHLSPSYDYELRDNERMKAGIRFWFIWLTSFGTGSSWFMHLMGIHSHEYPLVYVHQLQNIFFLLTGKELTLQP